MRHTPYNVSEFLPSFVRESGDYNNFIEFMDSYYDFMNSYIIDYKQIRDIQYVSDSLIPFLRREFIGRFPNSVIDDRKLIRIAKELYNKKGTNQGIELLFRIFYNEAITVRLPNTQILRASDGKWVQQARIAIPYIGNLNELQGNVSLILKNSKGIFSITIESLLQDTDTNTLYFNFNLTKKIEFSDVNNVIDVYNNGVFVFSALLKRQAAKVSLLTGGKYWKKGQVFRIPGTEFDTIVRVVDIDANGTITKINVFRYGSEHAENQTVAISPFPNRPASASVIEFNVTTVGGNIFYSLDISEETDSMTEDFLALSSYYVLNPLTDARPQQYFAVPPSGLNNDYYTNDDYNGFELVSFSETLQQEDFQVIDPTLTNEKWLESRALLRYEYDYMLVNRGEWIGNEGRISNANIRIQDSYYYQLFSYVISSSIDYENYKDTVAYMNPAGLKYFGELQKSELLQVSTDIISSSATEIVI